MNKIFRLLMIFLTATCLLACKDDNEEIVGGATETIEINEADRNHSFGIAGGSNAVSVTAGNVFTLEAVGGEWLTVSEIVSIAKVTTFQINVAENANIEARSGKIILSLKGAESVEIDISQDGAPVLAADRQSLELSSGITETVVYVNSSAYTATVVNGEGWLTAEPHSTGLRIRTARNSGSGDRNAAVVIHVDGYQDVMLRVKQSFYEPPSISPQILEFDYAGSDRVVAVNADQSPYTVTVEANKPWLSARITAEGLRIRASDNFGDVRSAEVRILVEGEENDLILTVNQKAMPAGSREVVADRTDWTATARGPIYENWGDGGTFRGEYIPGGSPQLVLDGNRLTGWHTPVSDGQLPHCMVVDMLIPRKVTGIEIAHSNGAAGEGWLYFNTIQVYLSQTLAVPDEYRLSWGTAKANYTSDRNSDSFRIDMEGTPTGRYLILYFPDSENNNMISFTELNVYVLE